jgi:small subunit ribosomal protein S16
MPVKIRLRRDGAKKRPFYHVVAADSRRARDGRFIEELGYYNPIVAAEADPILVLKEERVRYWLSVGAQPTDTAAALLKRQGILERSQPRVAKNAAPAAPSEAAAAEAPAAETAPAAEEAPAAAEETTEEAAAPEA